MNYLNLHSDFYSRAITKTHTKASNVAKVTGQYHKCLLKCPRTLWGVVFFAIGRLCKVMSDPPNSLFKIEYVMELPAVIYSHNEQ